MSNFAENMQKPILMPAEMCIPETAERDMKCSQCEAPIPKGIIYYPVRMRSTRRTNSINCSIACQRERANKPSFIKARARATINISIDWVRVKKHLEQREISLRALAETAFTDVHWMVSVQYGDRRRDHVLVLYVWKKPANPRAIRNVVPLHSLDMFTPRIRSLTKDDEKFAYQKIESILQNFDDLTIESSASHEEDGVLCYKLTPKYETFVV